VTYTRFSETGERVIKIDEFGDIVGTKFGDIVGTNNIDGTSMESGVGSGGGPKLDELGDCPKLDELGDCPKLDELGEPP